MVGQEDIRPRDIEGLDLSVATEEASRPVGDTNTAASDKLGSVAPSMAANLTHGQRIRVEDLHNRTLGNRQKSQPEAEPKGEHYSQELEERRLRQVEEHSGSAKTDQDAKKRSLLNRAVREYVWDTRLKDRVRPGIALPLGADHYAEHIETAEALDSIKNSEATAGVNREYKELEGELGILKGELKDLGDKWRRLEYEHRMEGHAVDNAWNHLYFPGNGQPPKENYGLGKDLDKNARELWQKYPGLEFEEAKAILVEERRKIRDYLFPDQSRELNFAEADAKAAEQERDAAIPGVGAAREAFEDAEAKKKTNDEEIARLEREANRSSYAVSDYRTAQGWQAEHVDEQRSRLDNPREFAESLYDLNPEFFSEIDTEEFLAKLEDYRELLEREEVFELYMDGVVGRAGEYRQDDPKRGPETPAELLERSRRGLFKLEDPSRWRGGEGITRSIGRGSITLISPNFVRGLLEPEDITYIEEQTAKAEEALSSIDMTPREVAKIVKEASDKSSERFTQVAEESMRRERAKLIGLLPDDPQPAAA